LALLPETPPRAMLLSLYTSEFKPVIPAWMPESSHRDVKLWAYTSAQSSACAAVKLPSMALDSGIHAGMMGLNSLVYNDERYAWVVLFWPTFFSAIVS